MNKLITTILAIIMILTLILIALIEAATFYACLKQLNYNKYDVNRDGKVSATDYVLIKNYIMEN